MQALNRFEIVTSPSDADLALEISMTHSAVVPGPRVFRTGDGVVRVRIIDPKTHILLWAFYQHPEIADRIRTYRKNTDKIHHADCFCPKGDLRVAAALSQYKYRGCPTLSRVPSTPLRISAAGSDAR